ncbi:MAG: choice-of-anchor D domain-containing protein [Verrucomicrobiota bacterium JB023]|nr:choice-of-anchor D domain-containing protein [Verrucomicrobiota bacterium JB023]
MKALMTAGLLLLGGFSLLNAQQILVEGAQEQGYPTIPYVEGKPTAPSTSYGTSFADPAPSASLTRTFRVKNLESFGGAGLTLSASSSNSQFVVEGLASSIKPGSSDTFTISYDPASTGASIARIDIASNDPGKPLYQFEVSGAGGSISGVFKTASGEVLNLGNTPSAESGTDFGTLARGASSVTSSFVLENTGSLPLIYPELQFNSLRFESDYSTLSPVSLQPGETYPFSITARTDALGEHTEVVNAFDVDGDSPLLRFNISSEVVGSPGLSEPCRFEVGTGNCYSIPSVLDFGEVTVGSSSSILVLVSNDGEADLIFEDPALTSDNPAFFTQGLAGTFIPGESDTFGITFLPTEAGVQTGTITIRSNASGEEAVTIAVTATGVEPAAPGVRVLFEASNGTFSVSSGSAPSADVVLGESSERRFQLTNSGDAPLEIASITLDDSENFRLTGGIPQALSPGGQRVLTLVFEPRSIGAKSVSIIFDTNATTQPMEVQLDPFQSRGLPATGYALGSFRKVGGNFELTIPPFAEAESGAVFQLATAATLSASPVWGGFLGGDDLVLSRSEETIILIPATTLFDPALTPRRFIRLEKIALPSDD